MPDGNSGSGPGGGPTSRIGSSMLPPMPPTAENNGSRRNSTTMAPVNGTSEAVQVPHGGMTPANSSATLYNVAGSADGLRSNDNSRRPSYDLPSSPLPMSVPGGPASPRYRGSLLGGSTGTFAQMMEGHEGEANYPRSARSSSGGRSVIDLEAGSRLPPIRTRAPSYTAAVTSADVSPAHRLASLNVMRQNSVQRVSSSSQQPGSGKGAPPKRHPLAGTMAHGDKNLHRLADNHQSVADYDSSSKVPACSWCHLALTPAEEELIPCECTWRFCRTCINYIKDCEDNECPGCHTNMVDQEQWALMQRVLSDVDTPRQSFIGKDGARPSSKRLKSGELVNASRKNSLQMVPSGHGGEMVPVSLADYGYGSAAWQHPPEKQPERTVPAPDVTKRGLSRKLNYPGSTIGPYRIFVVIRFLALLAFIQWRVKTPVDSGFWLWIMSLVCEIWFAVSWVLDTLPKLTPVMRETYKERLYAIYDERGAKLPQVDVFITTADASKEPPLTTACTILSVLAHDYPASRLAVYLSDDGASMLMFDTMAETAGFARLWVPFCKRHNIEPRSPEVYFGLKVDFTKDKVEDDFVRSRRKVKREWEEFKVRVNRLVQGAKHPPTEGWTMADGSAWPGNNKRNHDGIIQVFLHPDGEVRDLDGNFLPPLIYVAREKRPGHDHNKKAGAMNALLRASALVTNGTYMLNLDCDHYVNNSQTLREALCFFLDPIGGYNIGYVQFPQRFDGIDKNDRYANHNTVFFDINMRGLDGQQGPVYVGTGCIFRRKALYGYYPPNNPSKKGVGEKKAKRGCLEALCCGLCCKPRKSKKTRARALAAAYQTQNGDEAQAELLKGKGGAAELPARMGMCTNFVNTATAEESLADDFTTGEHVAPHAMLSDVILTISCDYEDNTDWGSTIGWMYGSVTEDILTGMKIHTRGWRSAYCDPTLAAFKGSAPLNMTDRLHQVERWATGAVEIFFSARNPMWSFWGTKLQLRQRIAYGNNAFYPFTSIAIFTYCLLPPLALLTDYFFVPTLDREGVICFAALIISFLLTSILELRWSQVTFEAWWRNEQFWVIAGISSHFAAVIQGILKVVAGVEIAFTLTSKGSDEGDQDELHTFKFTWLLLPGSFIGLFNIVGVIVGVGRAISAVDVSGQWGKLLGKLVFSFWVLVHLYPFAKGLMGRRSKMPTIVLIWSMLLVIVVALLWSNFFGGSHSLI